MRVCVLVGVRTDCSCLALCVCVCVGGGTYQLQLLGQLLPVHVDLVDVDPRLRNFLSDTVKLMFNPDLRVLVSLNSCAAPQIRVFTVQRHDCAWNDHVPPVRVARDSVFAFTPQPIAFKPYLTVKAADIT